VTITNTALALGQWNVKLKPETPQDIIGALGYFGHVAVSTGRPDPRVSGDSLLRSARYVGVLRKITYQGEGLGLSGSGMTYWLGDENEKGPIITAVQLYTAANFVAVVNGLVAAGIAVTPGVIHSVAGAYTGFHQFVTIRKALTFVCATMTTDVLNPVEFRVNGDGTIDAGQASDLFHTVPQAAIVRRHSGSDMAVRALPGKAVTDEDTQDYSTDVILLGQGTGLGIASAAVSLPANLNPYKDIHGNPVKLARTVSQSQTDAANSLVQANIALNQFAKPRSAITLTTDQFDIEGDVQVGDSIWVHDPTAGLTDTSASPAELVFRGERINPVKLRVREVTWPIAPGMSVAYRDINGKWTDLTDYVVFENGNTSVVVGGYDRSLTNPTGRQEALGSRAAPNTSVPNAPAFTTPFVQAVYQTTGSGISKAQIQARWTRPTNTDGTAIIDGDHYEIQYRTSNHSVFPTTWAQAAGKTWAQLGTWDSPVTFTPGPYQVAYAPFDTTQLLVQELTPGVNYDFQIRAVDNAVPPNYSVWSATTTVLTNGDTIPPPPPAPPSVASSLISVQVTHMLGQASGGTFNLPADMHHLEVHAQYEPTFTPSAATLLGKLLANNGMILSQTPVVGTFPIQSTKNVYVKVVAVDESGNQSNPSTPVQSSAMLVDDSHISNLTVSKVLAGTISTDWLLGANIQTAPSGVRAGMNAAGIFAYDSVSNRTFFVDAATGNVSIVGTFSSNVGTAGVQISAGNPSVGLQTPGMLLFAAGSTAPAQVYSAPTGVGTAPSNFTVSASLDSSSNTTVLLMQNDVAALGYYNKAAPISAGSNGTFQGVGGAVVTNATSASLKVAAANGSGAIDGGFAQADRNSLTAGFEVAGSVSGTGQMRLTSTTATIGTLNSGGTFNAYTYVNGSGDLYLHGASGRTTYVDNTDLNCTGATRVNAPRFANNSNGANLEARSGPDVFFYWAAGALNIGNSGSNAFVKAFVIDHPLDPDRWLVHGCTESPDAGVEYWGEAEIVDHQAVVELPAYFEALCSPDNRQVQVSVVLPDDPPEILEPATPVHGPAEFGDAMPLDAPSTPEHALVFTAAASRPKDGRFRIACAGPDGTRVAWLVKAARKEAGGFEVEPLRSSVDVLGDGPYRYIVPKEAA